MAVRSVSYLPVYPRSHTKIGKTSVLHAVGINVAVGWLVRNDGTTPGIVGMRLRMEEEKLLGNKDWFEWNPREDRGGPGLIQNYMYEKIGAAGVVTVSSVGILIVQPGELVQAFMSWEIPGPQASQAAYDFWKAEAEVTFDIKVELIQLGTITGEFVQNVIDHSFDNVITITMAPTSFRPLDVWEGVKMPVLNITQRLS